MTAKEKRQELLTEAAELGLSFPGNISTQGLEDLVRQEHDNKALADSEIDEDPTEEMTEEDLDLSVNVRKEEGVTDAETAMRLKLELEFEKKLEERAEEIRATYAVNQNTDTRTDNLGLIKLKAQKKATRLIRCIITNRNPLKQSWEGEIFTVANDLIGQQRKYVPFSLEEGYHLPQIIVDTLKDKECTVFVNGKTKNGEKVKVGKLIKEYAIEILPPLTENELGELARMQTARGSIDDIA